MFKMAGGPTSQLDQSSSIDSTRASVQRPFLQWIVRILRKEVIQPQVPLRLPCYDLVPITEFTLGTCFPKVSTVTLGAPRFRGLTGGVYKAQEHIHRSIADLRLLAIPASCRRVAACNPN